MSEQLQSLNPRTGEVVGTHPVHTPAQVQAVVARAREAALWWGTRPAKERREILQSWKRLMVVRIDELVDLTYAENGKPRSDALLEIGLGIEHLDWAADHAAKVLGPQRRGSGMVAANMSASVEYHPLGVIGVIGPWNYPVFTPMGSIGYGLAAGNAVVFKPSEYTPGIGAWLAETFAQVCPQAPVLQVITGYGETGAALCRAGVDKVAFTGSTATGRRVMAACAETLTPVIIEAGGKDALLVDQDADVAAAADAAVWGACSNAGQTCAGVERAYVHHRVYDDFLDQVVTRARDLRADDGEDAKLGPITMPDQVQVIRRHVEDAVARGGRVLVGGPETVGERYVQPTILADVPEEAAAVQEETFGPTLTITKVRDMDEALTLANASRYGLGSTVFARSRARELASRLRTGMTSINSVISFAAIPSLPFGGVGDSGFGRVHGEEGLREFCYAKAVSRRRFTSPLELTTFSRTAKQDRQFRRLLTTLHGRRRTPSRSRGRRAR